MADEFKHKDVGEELSRAEWEGIDTHQLDNQAKDDLIVATSATQLSRLVVISSRIIAKLAAGDTKACTPAEIRTLLTLTDAEIVAIVEAAGLTLAALKKIIFANDGKAQFGVLDGSPTLFGGHAVDPWELFLQPKDGDRTGEFGIKPSGTEDRAILVVHNASSMEDYGWAAFYINGLDVHLMAGQVGTGNAPTKILSSFPIVPYERHIYDLGESGEEWGSIYALHHQLKQPLIADHTWSGLTALMTAGTALTIGQAVYVGSDSKMEKALATGVATMPAIALATGTIAENAAGEFLMQGFFRDDTWNWTIGGLLYISKDTAGALTQTLPAASGEQVQVVGVAITADIIHFNPSYELVEIS